MHRYSHFRFCVVVVLSLIVGSWPLPAAPSIAKPEDVGLSSARLSRIGEMVQRRMASKDLAGAVTLVARRGRVAHLEPRGLMDLESKKPMVSDTVFRIASMSKPVTAVAVLMLMEEGKLRLTDPVSRFIPQFKTLKVAIPPDSPQSTFTTAGAEREITIRDLLTHTSGLVSGGISASEAAKSPKRPEETLADYIPRLAVFPLSFQPGARWTYSPLAAFDTLGRIVEIASGQTYDRFLKERLFDPLGMTSTSFAIRRDQIDRLATTYQRTPDGLRRTANQSLLTSDTYFSGAGGLFSTVEDYFKFSQMLLDRGEAGGRRLLSPTTVDLMAAVHVPDSLPGSPRGRAFGLGVQVIVDPLPVGYRVSSGSFGWSGAYCTYFWVSPKDKLVGVFLTQSAPFTEEFAREFENAFTQAIIE
jgi:CubicO group peptidase (beta-lactamase class C family)